MAFEFVNIQFIMLILLYHILKITIRRANESMYTARHSTAIKVSAIKTTLIQQLPIPSFTKEHIDMIIFSVIFIS